MVVKKGNPDDDELEQLADDIDPSDWKKFARKLRFMIQRSQPFISKMRSFMKMLLKWKQANGSAAVKKN